MPSGGSVITITRCRCSKRSRALTSNSSGARHHPRTNRSAHHMSHQRQTIFRRMSEHPYRYDPHAGPPGRRPRARARRPRSDADRRRLTGRAFEATQAATIVRVLDLLAAAAPNLGRWVSLGLALLTVAMLRHGTRRRLSALSIAILALSLGRFARRLGARHARDGDHTRTWPTGRMPLVSSRLASLQDANDTTLELEFRSRARYRYFEVPRPIVEGLVAATSKTLLQPPHPTPLSLPTRGLTHDTCTAMGDSAGRRDRVCRRRPVGGRVIREGVKPRAAPDRRRAHGARRVATRERRPWFFHAADRGGAGTRDHAAGGTAAHPRQTTAVYSSGSGTRRFAEGREKLGGGKGDRGGAPARRPVETRAAYRFRARAHGNMRSCITRRRAPAGSRD
ncbi:MAG: KTSC domain-containing protein [Luteitalea sp.]|nr:KTSC domain-containing protein [Luteitalea sp.]